MDKLKEHSNLLHMQVNNNNNNNQDTPFQYSVMPNRF